MPFEFEVESSNTAIENSQDHVSRYYSHCTYDFTSFVRRASVDIRDSRELTREEIFDRDTPNIQDSGIYLILSENGLTAYVGLALNFHNRFTTGYDNHSELCQPECGHFGHFANATRGAVDVGMPDGNCRFFILELIEHDGFGIQQAEIDWYYIFLANGWHDRSSNAIRKMTTSAHSLGRKGGTPSPTVVLRLSHQEYFYFHSTTEASSEFNLGTTLAPIINGQSSQGRGFTARRATADEIQTGLVGFERDVSWQRGDEGEFVELEDVCIGCSPLDEDRHSHGYKLRWQSGRLNQNEIEHLLSTSRGGGIRIGTQIQTEFKGVRWHSSNGAWQCGVRTGPLKENLSQPCRRAWTEPFHAALHRERRILREHLQAFNTGITGSNAELLNLLPERTRDGQIFVDWEQTNEDNN